MGIKKTLGGDRLGSGNRMKQEMHDFYRSNKNLSTCTGTTMAAGVLYPIYTNIALKGDTFDIDTNAFVRTIPTIGPVYGSFKLQVDFFQVPIRLFQAILHNNTIDIARKMNQVYLPKVLLPAVVKPSEIYNGFETQINESALMRYLNQSGVVTPNDESDFEGMPTMTLKRKICALPMLSYYNIFKDYYSNKQEENAYVITAGFEDNSNIDSVLYTSDEDEEMHVMPEDSSPGQQNFYISLQGTNNIFQNVYIVGENLDYAKIHLLMSDGVRAYNGTIKHCEEENYITITENTNYSITFHVKDNLAILRLGVELQKTYDNTKIQLTPFPLENIDKMKRYLLTKWDLGNEVVIGGTDGDGQTPDTYLPYSVNTDILPNGKPHIKYPMVGLCTKTYQSDMFNNWLDTEWVNEITETSAIDVSNGSFTLDMLNFKKKLYDHLNRLAISGGTYDDWQEATYGDRVWGKSEKPIYCGGLSSEVVFDEVVSTAATQKDVLGTIAGRGTLKGRKGGHITIKVGEASVIMGIASLTPRLMYSQGNAWYNTELDTMDDLHKPIFDRIGFQDLMVEQMAWWDAKAGSPQDAEYGRLTRTSAGKQPAWIQYATDIDRVYGDFAKENGTNYMVLTRRYEQDFINGRVKDVTTYIDPQKFNYPFAYQDLDAQNFWTFINMKIHARRKMSNTQIPNV